MFTKAIVRRPCRNMVNGISSSKLGLPVYENALRQHDQYIKTLERCGLNVYVLQEDENFPDSVFVEDTAIVTKDFAVVTRPGTKSREGEATEMLKILKQSFKQIEFIEEPGSLDGGDIMKTENHFYIGLSGRTNPEGARQLSAIVSKYGYSASTINLSSVLHLKTGISYLEHNILLASGEFLIKSELKKFRILEVPVEEAYASNSLWINGTIIVPSGFPKVAAMIKETGFPILEADTSEFRKLDGGLSCLSLRY